MRDELHYNDSGLPHEKVCKNGLKWTKIGFQGYVAMG